jgi:hypothetical protein
MVDQLNLPPDTGLVVQRVDPASAAGQAGLREHDVLLTLDGHAVSGSPADLTRILDEIQPGSVVDVSVLRKGKQVMLRGLACQPSAAAAPPSAIRPPHPSQADNSAEGFAGAAGVMTTLAWVDNRFTTRHQEGTLTITISGRRTGSQLLVTRIEVVDGIVAVHFDDAARVPARYGDKARYLLELSAAADPLLTTGAP